MFRHLSTLVAVALCAAAASAQVVIGPTLYRLDGPTTFEEGCQAPCTCPIAFTDDLFGTFIVQFHIADPAGYIHYTIDDVNWVIDMLGSERRVTGSGEYKVGGQFGLNHQLQLDLSIDGAAPIHFDSGLVPGGGSFPVIDIAIAQNGFFCWDRVFRLVASAVPTYAILPLRLGRSMYEEGCLPPCTCPILVERAAGRFNLVDLGPASVPTKHHYALVKIGWLTMPTAVGQTFKGFGIYSQDASAAKQRLICDLTDDSGVSQRFDSGLVNGGALAPAIIDIDVAVNGFYCYDQVFLLHAMP